MSGEIKLLITSDIHLGLEAGAVNISEKIRFNTFKKIINIAEDHDFLIIAGDLINNPDKNKGIIDDINQEIKGLKEKNTRILFSPGMDEVNADGNVCPAVFNLDFHHIFSKIKKPETVNFNINGQNIFFYGMPYSVDFDILKIKKESGSGFHAGIFHAGCDFRNIKMEAGNNSNGKILSGLDFYALGFNHGFRMFRVIDKIIGVYPGSPEAASMNETGDRYVVSIKVSGNKISSIRRLCVNSVNVSSIEIDCSKISNIGEIIRILEDKRSDRDIFRLDFTGIKTFRIDDDMINKEKIYYHDLIINDNSIPSVELIIDKYINENTIRGEFYRVLKDRIDKKNFPLDLNMDDLSYSLHVLSENESESMEELLCNM